jgi:DNA-binding XRE family transcriptional regulator
MGRSVWVEQHKADLRQVATRESSGDDSARFLRELRQLRDGAGLGQAELAARAHYPHDSIKAAEAGPSLPDLPVLTAYVRGCGGTPEEWEERWRSLTRSPSLPVPAARHAGNSAAASAGARIGSVTHEADSPDPSMIIAALNRVAEGMASGGDAADAPADVQAWQTVPAETPAETASPGAGARAAAAWPDAGPDADSKPAGWDPIRVSTAWPALREPDSDPPASRSAASAGATSAPSREAAPREAPPWESTGWADSPAASGTSDPAPAAPSSRGTAKPAGRGPAKPGARGAAKPAVSRSAGRPVAAKPVGGRPAAGKQAASRPATPRPATANPATDRPQSSPPAAARPTGTAARPSRTKIVVLCAVVLCVLAVVLAIFL